MAAFNLTSSAPSILILNGIPGLETAHIWISIPFFILYILCLLANSTVLFVVGKEETLHKPMYLLLCMLALTDISMSTCVMPKALCIFWFGFKEITGEGCLTQMFFFHVTAATHSGILAAMGFERYIAISEPLRYGSILTNVRAASLALVGLTRSALFFLPVLFLLLRLPFCINRVIQHTYCEHMAILKILCVDTTVNQRYALVILLVFTVVDLGLIVLFYALIIRAVLRISSQKAHQKALNTCTAHVCVIIMSYTSNLFTSLTHRFGEGIGAHVHIILANLYVVIPPMLNPIIYGIKTKELRGKVGKYVCRM
uniref:G-protein coupled receptors family 1 profile domain-containing protein n=1 Tax=Pelusios castaneus TaxID=367368 RepID=A0A8C8RNK9_9SAUR